MSSKAEFHCNSCFFQFVSFCPILVQPTILNFLKLSLRKIMKFSLQRNIEQYLFKGVQQHQQHPNQKLSCFVLYLKIINTFLKNNIYASYSKL